MLKPNVKHADTSTHPILEVWFQVCGSDKEQVEQVVDRSVDKRIAIATLAAMFLLFLLPSFPDANVGILFALQVHILANK